MVAALLLLTLVVVLLVRPWRKRGTLNRIGAIVDRLRVQLGVDGVPRWPDSHFGLLDFKKEWELFKSAPAGYVPPQVRD